MSGFLDYAMRPGWLRIEVRKFVTVKALEGLYFQRPASPRLLLNYVREIGVKSTIQKVLSRSAERLRNRKYLSIGAGFIEHGPGQATEVLFIAPRHPQCVDILALPSDLVRIGRESDVSSITKTVSYSDLSGTVSEVPEWLVALAGWDPDSGWSLPPIDWVQLSALLELSLPEKVLQIEPLEAGVAKDGISLPSTTPAATLVGYGNYAKTVILPSLPAGLSVRRIHEVDPMQVPRRRHSGVIWSTTPTLAPDDKCNVVFVAGYHHSHASLAVEALAGDKDCVVEKPLAVNRAQLDAVHRALSNSKGRMFACFHKRYSPFIAFAREDLGVTYGQPINYHAIVFEVPLPPQHWYRWPNSGSRLVSNGCHWIDHFLFLNGWSETTDSHVYQAPDGMVGVFLVLKNGACMTMTLTDIGSGRVGVRDHVQLRAGEVTVRIENDSYYVAEDGERILRRTRINKMNTYRRMYAHIGAAILAGSPGDTLESIHTTTSVVLGLEEKLAHIRAKSGVL